MRLKRVLVSVVMIVSIAAFAGAEKIKMAVFLLEPFMMEGPDKKAAGVTVEYWQQYIAPKMGVEVEVLGPYPILRATKMLEDGEVDTVSQLTKIPARAEMFLFPQTNITEIVSCIMVNPDSPLKEIKKPEDLYGMRIGFMEAGAIPSFLKNDKITFELVSSEDYRMTNLNKLFGKRLDAVLDINYASMLYYLKTKGLTNKVRVIKLPVEPLKVYSIFQKSEKGERLMKMYEKAINEVNKTDAFDKLSKKYLE